MIVPVLVRSAAAFIVALSNSILDSVFIDWGVLRLLEALSETITDASNFEVAEDVAEAETVIVFGSLDGGEWFSPSSPSAGKLSQ